MGVLIDNIIRSATITIAVFILILSSLFLENTASASIEIGSCTTISSPGIYEIIHNITNNSASFCINITSEDVFLDGAGYTIARVNTDSTYGTDGTFGVHVYNSTKDLTNVNIKNLNTKDWGDGILYMNVSNGRIENNTAKSNSDGIQLVYSKNITLIYNKAISNRFGIYLEPIRKIEE